MYMPASQSISSKNVNRGLRNFANSRQWLNSQRLEWREKRVSWKRSNASTVFTRVWTTNRF